MRRAAWIGLAVASLLLASGADASCPSTPRPWCRAFARTRLRVDTEANAFLWSASRGPSTTLADLGSPQTTTTYSLCAWSGEQLALATDIPAASTCGEAACWSLQGTGGLRYRKDEAVLGELASLDLKASTRGRTRLKAAGMLAATLPIDERLTVQLLRDDSPICLEGSVPVGALLAGDAGSTSARVAWAPTAPVPALSSPACGGGPPAYPAGVSSPGSLMHDGIERTFRVHVPAAYDDADPTPLVVLLHGGFGSGAQIEASSRMLGEAEAEGFVVVSPDGVAGPGGVRTWNGGRCCGAAASNEVDDVGFIAALLDHLEQALCLDRRRVFATGMSNGGILSHRLACDLGHRIAAVAPVAGTEMTTSCDPARPVPLLEIHGSADLNVPFDGGFGCGASNANYRSVPATIASWKVRNDCKDAPTSTSTIGDATCTVHDKCSAAASVELCVIENGGHQWPGGEPPSIAGLPDCPFGYQSPYPASQRAWAFFNASVAR